MVCYENNLLSPSSSSFPEATAFNFYCPAPFDLPLYLKNSMLLSLLKFSIVCIIDLLFVKDFSFFPPRLPTLSQASFVLDYCVG